MEIMLKLPVVKAGWLIKYADSQYFPYICLK